MWAFSTIWLEKKTKFDVKRPFKVPRINIASSYPGLFMIGYGTDLLGPKARPN